MTRYSKNSEAERGREIAESILRNDAEATVGVRIGYFSRVAPILAKEHLALLDRVEKLEKVVEAAKLFLSVNYSDLSKVAWYQDLQSALAALEPGDSDER